MKHQCELTHGTCELSFGTPCISQGILQVFLELFKHISKIILNVSLIYLYKTSSRTFSFFIVGPQIPVSDFFRKTLKTLRGTLGDFARRAIRTFRKPPLGEGLHILILVSFVVNYFVFVLPDENVSKASEGSHDFHNSVMCLYIIGSDVGLSVWPSTGITKKVLKNLLNRFVDLANASTVLIAEKLAMESLQKEKNNNSTWKIISKFLQNLRTVF